MPSSVVAVTAMGGGALLLYCGIKNRNPVDILKGIAAGNFDVSKAKPITATVPDMLPVSGGLPSTAPPGVASDGGPLPAARAQAGSDPPPHTLPDGNPVPQTRISS